MIRHNWVRRCLITAVLAVSLTVNASAASFGVGTVNADALNLRAAPTTDSASLGLVRTGVQVDVLEDAVDGWYKVQYNGQTGYMSADYLLVATLNGEAAEAEETVETESVPESEAPAAPKYGNGKVTLDSGSLNIRAEASTLGARLGAIPNGVVLALDEYVDGWYYITYDEVTGYVSEDYIVATTEPVTVVDHSVTTAGADVVAKAKEYLGCPYRYGKAGPNSFDCSGFTSYIYKLFGYSLNRTASGQLNNDGTPVAREDLQPGDLVFFRDYSCTKSASHVGMYIGNGQFIHASSSRSATGVKISSLSENWYANRYVGARRVIV